MVLDSTFVIILPALVLALYAQMKVQSSFRRYSHVRSSSGYTGARAAAELLRRQGLTDVRVERVQGFLADHYDPRRKVLRLSPDVHDGSSLAALGVAAHEAGHALQHRDRYAPLVLRSAVVPLASFGTNAAIILFMIGLVASLPALMDLGILLFLGYVVFVLVTLPVEFNASRRAVALLQGQGFVLPHETAGVRAVLNAAALTYVAAAAMAVLQFLRLVLLRTMRR